MSLHPACLQDGEFQLISTYSTQKTTDSVLQTNTSGWSITNRFLPLARRKSSYHLIQPSNESHLYAKSKGLVSYRQWMHLLHDNVFIHGPFDLTMTANGRQSKDRVSVKNWRILHNHRDVYANNPPSTRMVSELSIHCTPLFYTQVNSTEFDERLLVAPLLLQNYYC